MAGVGADWVVSLGAVGQWKTGHDSATHACSPESPLCPGCIQSSRPSRGSCPSALSGGLHPALDPEYKTDMDLWECPMGGPWKCSEDWKGFPVRAGWDTWVVQSQRVLKRCYCGILMFKGCTRKLEQGFFTKVCSGRTRHNNFKQKEGRFRLHARKKKRFAWGKKAQNDGLERATLVSVCGCTGCRDAAAFDTNSAWNSLAASVVPFASSEPSWCSRQGKSLTLHFKQKYQFPELLFWMQYERVCI